MTEELLNEIVVFELILKSSLPSKTMEELLDKGLLTPKGFIPKRLKRYFTALNVGKDDYEILVHIPYGGQDYCGSFKILNHRMP